MTAGAAACCWVSCKYCYKGSIGRMQQRVEHTREATAILDHILVTGECKQYPCSCLCAVAGQRPLYLVPLHMVTSSMLCNSCATAACCCTHKQQQVVQCVGSQGHYPWLTDFRPCPSCCAAAAAAATLVTHHFYASSAAAANDSLCSQLIH
jgi:hypothetical protein